MFLMMSTVNGVLPYFFTQMEMPFISLNWKRKVLVIQSCIQDNPEDEPKEWERSISFLGSCAGTFLGEGKRIYQPTFKFYLDFEQARIVFGELLSGDLVEYKTDVDVLCKQRWLSFNKSGEDEDKEYTLRIGYYGEGFLAFDLTQEETEKLSSSVLSYLMDDGRG